MSDPRFAVRAVGPAGYEYDTPGPFETVAEACTAANAFQTAHPDLIVFAEDLREPEVGPIDEDYEL